VIIDRFYSTKHTGEKTGNPFVLNISILLILIHNLMEIEAAKLAAK
jgi:hypothetical protein